MNIVYEKCTDFENKTPNTKHFITTNCSGFSGGNYSFFNLGQWCGEEPSVTKQNLELLSEALDIQCSRIFVPREIHSNKVAVIDKSFLKKSRNEQINLLSDADALITFIPQIVIAVSTADCVPIICTDNNKFVAVIHAGWRGIVTNIIKNTIQTILDLYSNTESLYFMVGPCISGENYEVGSEVWTLFQSVFNQSEQQNILYKQTESKFHPDLRTAASLQIKKAAPEATIYQFEVDTYTDNRFYSVRKSGYNTGRFLTGIFIK